MNITIQVNADGLDALIPKMERFEDKVVYGLARATLDWTAGHFPYKTGALSMGSLSTGVMGGNKVYGLGFSPSTPYATYVYDMGEGTNWTNASTYAHWYHTTYQNHTEKIISNAILMASRELL